MRDHRNSVPKRIISSVHRATIEVIESFLSQKIKLKTPAAHSFEPKNAGKTLMSKIGSYPSQTPTGSKLGIVHI